jgi:hypothetical protein
MPCYANFAAGLVELLAAGEVEGHSREAPSYWLLSDEGRAHLDRLG